ncbi:MAG TPA: transcriptional repressor, partial [Woeseiaceae bacterium]|nr:transcriptional repressor [Woeseiaceae bacterium]
MSRADILKKLEQHHVTATPQRVEVAEVLLERPQHLSADQILERLREGGSRVSKATVYNTLKLFSERGLV